MAKKLDIENFNISELSLEELKELAEEAKELHAQLMFQLRLREMALRRVNRFSK